jgi:hypothetical protein
MEFFDSCWCGSAWTEWVPLDPSAGRLKTLPLAPGVYRVRPSGGSVLLYIGQTGRTLRARIRELAHAYRDAMPFNDPHTAAPHLWALRTENSMTFEVSTCPMDTAKKNLRGMEDYLLWKYRLERGESTVCNYGRFHPQFTRPTNMRDGRAGQRISNGVNPNSGPSYPPLRPKGEPTGPDWMGLYWSEPAPLKDAHMEAPNAPGVYRIWRKGSDRLSYLGESMKLRSRLKTHGASALFGQNFLCGLAALQITGKYQVREVESDLLGAYYELKKRIPEQQYGKQPDRLSNY